MNIEDTLKKIGDRQEVVTFVSQMPEGSKGFVVFTDANGDPDWRWFGEIKAWEGAGLLEFLRIDIFADREEEEDA